MDIDWDNLPVHPALEAMPTMSAEELAMLTASIKKNGLRVPIVVWRDNRDARPGPEGMNDGVTYLVDGRARLAALRSLGISDPTQARGATDLKGTSTVRYTRAVINAIPLGGGKMNVIEDTVPEAVVWDLNGERLHLDRHQRDDAIRRYLAANPKKSASHIGRLFKVDHKTVLAAVARGAEFGENSQLPQSPAERALTAIVAQPTASNRQIAKRTEIDEGTVRNARRKMSQGDALAQAEKIIASAMITMDPLDAPLKQVMLTIRKYVRRAGERGPDLIQRLMVELASYDHEVD